MEAWRGGYREGWDGRMDRFMGGKWMDERIDGWMDEWVDGWMDGCLDARSYVCMRIRMYLGR